jgi:hypothetical protein
MIYSFKKLYFYNITTFKKDITEKYAGSLSFCMDSLPSMTNEGEREGVEKGKRGRFSPLLCSGENAQS